MLSKVTKNKLSKRIAGRLREKLTTEQRVAIVTRYANNERAADLAIEYGVSLFTVYKWINAYDKEAERRPQ
jgi:transposase